jgi:hypothetical protein
MALLQREEAMVDDFSIPSRPIQSMASRTVIAKIVFDVIWFFGADIVISMAINTVDACRRKSYIAFAYMAIIAIDIGMYTHQWE